MENAICLITNKPANIFLEFLNTFTKYDVFIIIDDNSKKYNLEDLFPRLKIIQMPDFACERVGIKNINAITLKKSVSGWDKAICYFAIYNATYKNVWFVEDDVFFNNEETMVEIDKKYINADLLCNSDLTFAKNREDWLWRIIDINMPPPYVCGMMCACRMSRTMISSLKNYADKNKTLFFLEALFPTIALHNSLSCLQPKELLTITHRNEWDIDTLTGNNLYHPMKKIEDHLVVRARLSC